MTKPLTEKEVDTLYQLLTSDQKDFLDSYIKQNKKSKWLEVLSIKKGIVIEDLSKLDTLDDWELLEILDSGYGKRSYKCECGMPLRNCYVVYHRKEGKTYHLGIKCFVNYTSLTQEIVNDILKGFHTINLERDEILTRFEQDWKLPSLYFKLELPEQIREQLNIGLPLSSNQMRLIERLLHDDLRKQRETAYFNNSISFTNSIVYKSPTPQFKVKPKQETITYFDFLIRHLNELKEIREHEHEMALSTIKRRWQEVQEAVKSLRDGKEFDYQEFKDNLSYIQMYLRL